MLPNYNESFPTLHTERLLLREVTPADIDALFHLRGDPEVTRLNIGAPYTDHAQAETLLRHTQSTFRSGREIWWGITLPPDTTVVGFCILYNLNPPTFATLGYELAREQWGKGVMQEATRAVLQWGFETLSLTFINADTDSRNDRSARLLRRVGFRPTETSSRRRGSEGNAHELHLYELSRADWQESHFVSG